VSLGDDTEAVGSNDCSFRVGLSITIAFCLANASHHRQQKTERGTSGAFFAVRVHV